MNDTLASAAGVGTVTLLARDLPALAQFYQTLLGLQVTEQSAQQVTLAAYGRPLLHLRAAPELPAPAVSRPGLYHTAFLLPTRADLGRWVAHADRLGLRLGAGDHLVSEAFYLSDPEGNGIEVYADRPREDWVWENGEVKMDTLSVDVAGVLQAAGLTPADLQNPALAYAGVPAGTTVGHVHLKVGSAAEAAGFYADTLGLDVVSHVPGAAFLSWGGYHHHLGLNEWHSRGQGRPASPATGLGAAEFLVPDLSHVRAQPGVTEQGGALHLTDPWGNQILVRQLGG